MKKNDLTAQIPVIRQFRKDQKIHIGVFKSHRHGGYLSSCNRKDSFKGQALHQQQAQELTTGDVVKFSLNSQHEIKIISRLGNIEDPLIFSEIAIHTFDLPSTFSEDALKIAKRGKVPSLENRVDYRGVDLVTIDGEDARDFDDAVWAEKDPDVANIKGWRVIVAVADVSYYVPIGSALDKEAYERGNSVYFPNRVIPMLPEVLSNELCSLKPHEDRACMVVEMIITSHGKLKSCLINRGLMRSRARLTYHQVQNALNNIFDDTTKELQDRVLNPLYGVYKSLLKAKKQRGTLDLDIPERQILFDKKGHVKDIILRERFDSHKLIEELMIMANVAAAKTLVAKKEPCLFRVHDKPEALRVENLKHILKKLKIGFSKAQSPDCHHFNHLLQQMRGQKQERMINDLVLRSQTQAKYSPENLGHFGLSLSHYAHFTSPIRRYSDLIVHRCLISALGLGTDGYENKPIDLDKEGQHISQTERIAAQAEREVSDRLAISYVSNKVGQIFRTVIVGVNRAGLFVEIPGSGAQGFIPKNSLGEDLHFDEQNHRFIGHRTQTSFQLGDFVEAFLEEANVVTNSLLLRLANLKTSILKKRSKKIKDKKGKSNPLRKGS